LRTTRNFVSVERGDTRSLRVPQRVQFSPVVEHKEALSASKYLSQTSAHPTQTTCDVDIDVDTTLPVPDVTTDAVKEFQKLKAENLRLGEENLQLQESIQDFQFVIGESMHLSKAAPQESPRLVGHLQARLESAVSKPAIRHSASKG